MFKTNLQIIKVLIVFKIIKTSNTFSFKIYNQIKIISVSIVKMTVL
jgi:hypothetical protein